MHRRDSYIPADTPRPRRLRRRIATGVVALTSVAALTGVTAGIASAHETSTAHRPYRVAGWTMPAIDRSMPRVVSPKRDYHHRGGWMFRMKKHGVPPTAAAEDSAAEVPSQEATASAAATPTTPASAAASASATTASSAAGSAARLFSAASPWNTLIGSDAAADANSSQIVSKVLNNRSLVVNLAMYAYGIPFYTATASTPRVTLGGRNPMSAVPLDPSWQPNEGGDQKMNVIDPATHTVYELQGYDPAARSAFWAVKKDYTTSLADGFPQDGLAGPTGSGLTQEGGVIRLAEMSSGKIDHALSFITSSPVSGFRYPASHSDGSGSGAGVQEGMRIQLDPSLDLDSIPGITRGEKAIAKALQQYGAYCTDNGGNNNMAMGFYVEKPKAGDADPYPAAGFPQDWAQLPHIPRDKLRVLAASATPRPN